MPKKSTTRAAQGSGTIRQRPDGTWEARYTVPGGDPGTGRQIQKSIYGETQQEVRKQLAQITQSIDRGIYTKPSRITVSAWLEEWFTVYVLPALRDSTSTGYQDTIRLHLIPKFGALKLQSLRPSTIQSGFNDLAKHYAPATLKKARTVLHAALKRAVQNNLIAVNPCEGIRLPSMADQEEIRYLTRDQQRRFLEALPDTTPGRALNFILGSGLRASECTGLRWCDIGPDFFEIRQTIRRNRNFGEGKAKTTLSKSPPKTKKGAREIPLTHKLRDILSRQRSARMEESLKLGLGWDANGLVFSTFTGTPMEGRNLTRALHSVLNKAGVERIGLHGLRHTFATRWIENGGEVKTLSEILGHASVKITLELYVHSTDETKKRAMAAMDVFL